ncbi:ribonuclease H protein [Pyrus ussuriensis x Pyrus communis]|uniref:Ribonuclease H protein n=1 Tax=Pyrus ussuriensis x Pyrus communis TaxID=2448454 RepID=A0A5N5GRI5_9ROSA|nr:ribonuclease H protein [Pyrus ussuriensis x Pyrus communis]
MSHRSRISQARGNSGNGVQVIAWCPPPYPMIKVNVNGAWKGNLLAVGIGVVMRDSMGSLTGGSCIHLIRSSPEEMEAETILEGLKLVAFSDQSNVVLENDCKTVMDIIQKRDLKGLWKIIPIVEVIRRHACLFSSLHWK